MAASAYITLTAKDAVTPTLKKIQGEMEAVARSVRTFGDNITSFATLGFGAGAAMSIYEVGKAGIESSIQLEKLEKAFSAIYGDAGQATQQLEFIRQTSRELGQEFYSVAEGAKTFFAAGQGTALSDQLNAIYTGFSKAGAALALSSDDMQGIFLALGQSISKGKIQADELRGQIGERLPGAFQLAARAMGVSTAELDKMMSEGKLLTDDLLPKLAKLLDELYGPSAKGMADTTLGALNALKTAWIDFKAGLIDSQTAISALNGVRAALEGMTTVGDVMAEHGEILPTLTAVAAAMGAVTIARKKDLLAAGQQQAAAKQTAELEKELIGLEQKKLVLLAQERQADNLAARLIGTENEARAEAVLAQARQRLAAVNTQLAATESRLDAARSVWGRSMGIAASALSGLRAAGASVVSFLGGPLGIAFTTAAAGAAYFATRQDEAAAASQRHYEAQLALHGGMQRLTAAIDEQGKALEGLDAANRIAERKKQAEEYRKLAEDVAEGMRAIYQEYAQADNYESFVNGLDTLSDQYAQLKNIFQSFGDGSLSAEQLQQALEQLRAETVKAHGENNALVRSLDEILASEGGVVSALVAMSDKFFGLGDAAAKTAEKVQLAKATMAGPWSIDTGDAQKSIDRIKDSIRGMQAERLGLDKGLVGALPRVEPEKLKKAYDAFKSGGMVALTRELGDAYGALSDEQKKNLSSIFTTSSELERQLAIHKRWKDSQKDSGRSAVVSQADYNGELERTRQTIDSLQQQLGLDKTEDLARAKIRIEQQYQATLSKTSEELAKQVAQGKLTQGQADTLKAEKDKAAELQKQVALRDAEQKAQEKSIQLAEGQLKFFRELGELSGDYGQSIELQNDLIEKQARKYKDVYQISDELVDRWTELQKLQVSQDPFDGAYRGLLKFSAEYADSGRQWESITYSFAGNFNGATRDMFDTFLDTGRASFASLEASFSSLLKNMAYQAFVQPVVLSIVGGVQQSVYGMTTAGSGGMNLLSTGAGLAQQYASSQLFSSMGGSGLLGGVTSGINSFGASALPGVFAPNAAIAAVNAGTATPAQVIAAIQSGHSGLAGLGGMTTVTGLLGAAGMGFGLGSLGGGLLGNLVGLNSGGSSIGGGIGGALGAGIGSIIPGIGTALGGIVGGALGSIVGGLFGGGDTDPGMSLNAFVDLAGGNVGLPSGWMEYGTTGNGYAVWSGTWEGISDELNKQGSDALAEIIQQQLEGVSAISEAVQAIGNSSLEAAYEASFAANRTFMLKRHWEDEEVNLQEFLESVPGLFQEQMYKVLAGADLSGIAVAADGAIADTMPEVAQAIMDAMSYVALGENLGEYQDDFEAAISDKLIETLNQLDTSGIALDIDKSSLAGWQAAAEALQGWQTVTDALDEILEPTSELASTLATATTQFDGWIDQLEALGWKEEAIAEIEARRAQYMNEYASALTRATEQDLYLRSLSLQYGDDSLEYGLQSLKYQQQNELAELAKKFGKDSAIYNQAVETQQAELLAYQIQYWQSALQEQVTSQQQVVDALDDLVDALEDARADLWASDKNLMGRRYDEALAQFDAAYQQAMSGDQEALAQLPTLASSLLALGKDNLATSQEYNDLFYDVDRKLKLAQEQAVKQVDAAQAQLDALNAMLAQGDEQQLTLEEISAKLSELMDRYQQELADITGGGSLSQREALIQAKVDQLNTIAQGGRTDWTAESFLSYMYGQGLTLQNWYDRFGKNENLGVSYDSAAAYQAILENKAALMNAGLTLAAGQTAGGWTAEKVLEQIRQDGMTVDEWYLRYGLQEGVGEYYKQYSQDAADSTNETIEKMEDVLSGRLSSINSSVNGLDWNVVVNVSGGVGGAVSGGGSSSGGSSGGSASSGSASSGGASSGTASGGWSDILQDKADALNRGETLAPGQTAGGWTADKVLDQIHQDGMTIEEWYDRFGKPEGFASGGITPVNRPFWVGENGPELMMSPRQYGVLSNPASMELMDRPVMDSSSIITAIRDSGQSIYSVLRQLLTKTDAMYGQQRRILQRLDMWDAEGLPS